MRLAPALLLAGCLSEPGPAPIGHGHELRPRTLVARLDNDAYDDLVTWGHLGDPRTHASVMIRFGNGATGLAMAPDVTIDLVADATAAWHDIVDVSLVTKLDGSPQELVALLVEDAALPPGGETSRVAHVVHLPLAGRTPPTPQIDPGFPAAGLGGTTAMPTFGFVAGYNLASGSQQLLAGSDTAFWQGALAGAAPTAVTTAQLSLQDGEPVAGVYALPKDPGDSHQNLLVLTNRRALVVAGPGPSYTVSLAIALTDNGARLVSAHAVGAAMLYATVGANSPDIMLVQAAGTGQPIGAMTFHGTKPPSAIGLADFANDGLADVVTLENNALTVYYGVMSGAPAWSAATGDLANDVLTVGHFADADPIYIWGSWRPLDQGPDCYQANAVTHTLDGC